MALQPQPRCLFFDVFGTCVDWRKTVNNELWHKTREALDSPNASIASHIRMLASDMTYEQWGEVAQQWRNGYLVFTREFAADPSKKYKTIDQHHLESLRSILTERGLIFPRDGSVPDHSVHDGSLWNEEQIRDLSMVWHRLDPWPDTCRGIQELNRHFWTCTLSNGNVSLLQDMVASANMEFTHVFSAEMFQSYKPNRRVYLGAAEKMGLKPEDCCMVAAHLDDLKAAKANGFSTIYVERPQEERHLELANEGFVDVWVNNDEEGFVALSRKLEGEVIPTTKEGLGDPSVALDL